MIKLFRKIRQKLLTENKFSKYLIYAVGEIILVVIGILIALSINNWNENRKETTHEQKILKELKSDFSYNKQELNRNIEKATALINRCDSLIVLFGLDRETVNPNKVIRFTRSLSAYSTFDPSNGALNDLISSGNLNVIKNDSLRMQLSRWFGQLEDVKEDEKRLINFGDTQLNPIRLEYLNYNPKSKLIKNSIELLEYRKFENIVMYISGSANYIVGNYKTIDIIIDKILDDINDELKSD